MHRRESIKREFPDEFDALRRFGSSLLHLQRPRRRFQLCSCSQLHTGVRGPGRAPSFPSLSLTSHFPDFKDTCSDSFLKPCIAESSCVIPSPIEFRFDSLAEAFHAAFANDNVGHPASRKDRFEFWAPPCRGHVVSRAAEEATVLYTIQLIAGFVFFLLASLAHSPFNLGLPALPSLRPEAPAYTGFDADYVPRDFQLGGSPRSDARAFFVIAFASLADFALPVCR